MFLKVDVKIEAPARITTCTGPHWSTGSANNRLAGSGHQSRHRGVFFLPVVSVVHCAEIQFASKTEIQMGERQVVSVDSIEFAREHLPSGLKIRRHLDSVALHAVCSVVKTGLMPKLYAVAAASSQWVIRLTSAGRCAFAGDLGFLHPELAASATRSEAEEVNQHQYGCHYSKSRTYEIGLTRATGIAYRSNLHLIDEANQAVRRFNLTGAEPQQGARVLSSFTLTQPAGFLPAVAQEQ